MTHSQAMALASLQSKRAAEQAAVLAVAEHAAALAAAPLEPKSDEATPDGGPTSTMDNMAGDTEAPPEDPGPYRRPSISWIDDWENAADTKPGSALPSALRGASPQRHRAERGGGGGTRQAPHGTFDELLAMRLELEAERAAHVRSMACTASIIGHGDTLTF